LDNTIREIIDVLTKKVSGTGEIVLEEDKIIEDLMDIGFAKTDILKAMELFFTESIIKPLSLGDIKPKYRPLYNRSFTLTEKVYLSAEAQKFLKKIVYSRLLTPEQNENLISRAVRNMYQDSLDLSLLWEIIEDIVEEETILNQICQAVPEFTDFFKEESQFIN